MAQTEPEASALLVVCDAGPIIHLDELSQLKLLNDFHKILIPETVWQEVQKHRPQALAICTQLSNRITPASPLSTTLQSTVQLFSLHAGEIQALVLAEEQQADLLLTDDTAARLAAGSLNIEVHGTLGILLRAIRRNQLTQHQVIDILHSIPKQSSLHIRPSLYDTPHNLDHRLR